jgi:hypothetical protein
MAPLVGLPSWPPWEILHGVGCGKCTDTKGTLSRLISVGSCNCLVHCIDLAAFQTMSVPYVISNSGNQIHYSNSTYDLCLCLMKSTWPANSIAKPRDTRCGYWFDATIT